MAYGSILGQSFENSSVLDNYFTKDETLTSDTAALYGLDTDATPDDVFNAIGGASGAGLIPVGTIIWFSKSTAPAGYLVCDGSSFSSSTYPALYAVLKKTTLPNLIGRFIKGSATPGLSFSGSYIIENSIQLSYGNVNYAPYLQIGNPASVTSRTDTLYTRNQISTASPGDTLTSKSKYLQPPNVTMLPCIKY